MPTDGRSPRRLAEDILADAGYATTLFDPEPDDRSVGEAARAASGATAPAFTAAVEVVVDDEQRTAPEEPQVVEVAATPDGSHAPVDDGGGERSGVADDGAWTAEAVAELAGVAPRSRRMTALGWWLDAARSRTDRSAAASGRSLWSSGRLIPRLLAVVALVACATVAAALVRGGDAAPTSTPASPAQSSPLPIGDEQPEAPAYEKQRRTTRTRAGRALSGAAKRRRPSARDQSRSAREPATPTVPPAEPPPAVPPAPAPVAPYTPSAPVSPPTAPASSPRTSEWTREFAP